MKDRSWVSESGSAESKVDDSGMCKGKCVEKTFIFTLEPQDTFVKGDGPPPPRLLAQLLSRYEGGAHGPLTAVYLIQTFLLALSVLGFVHALLPMRQLSMLARIHDLVRAGSQFIIATHSPILMAYPDATLLLMEQTIREVAYGETEHYTVMRDFFNHRAAMLRELME